MYPILISFPEIFVRASVIGHRDLHLSPVCSYEFFSRFVWFNCPNSVCWIR